LGIVSKGIQKVTPTLQEWSSMAAIDIRNKLNNITVKTPAGDVIGLGDAIQGIG